MAPQNANEQEQELELAKKAFQRAEQLFHETCGMAPAEREEYLQRKGVSEALRREIAALLGCDGIHDDAFDEMRLSASRGDMADLDAASSVMASIGPGTILGDFRMEEEIGRGGMAVVYRAHQISLNRTVALKVLCYPLLTKAVRQRFRREAAAGGQLQHDNIVTVHDFGQQDDLLFFAMELIEGPTLSEWLAHQQPQGADVDQQPAHSEHGRIAQVCRWVAEAASGLSHAHAHGVIHRDIKPSNLIVTPEGHIKILDFGVAKLRGEAGLTTTGALLGTPRYMSPEQLSPGDQEVDHRTDIYSLGAMMYELLTLRPPYTGENYGQVISKIRETEPPPPRHWNRRIPRLLETICLKAMAKNPHDRYQDAGDLARDLKNWLAGRPIAAVRRGPLARLVRAALLPRNRTAVVMASLLLICAAMMVWFLVQSKPKQIDFIGQWQITFVEKDDFAFDPSLSGNGRWLAYASDRGSESGDMNIWLQQLSKPGTRGGSIERIGDAIQITTDPANEIEPALSPDGRLLAFCTTGVDGAIHLMALDENGRPAESIPIGKGARSPRFSPDGRSIVWWRGSMSRQLGILGDSIWIASTDVASSTASEPRQFCPEFVMASYPVWAPDGKQLLFKGVLPPNVAAERKVTSKPDWWVAPVDGSQSARPLGVTPLLESAGIAWSYLCAPNWWTPQSHQIVFAGFSHSGMKLWALPLEPNDMAASRSPRLLTSGGLHEFFPATDAGLGMWERCCYYSCDFDYGIWSLPIDTDRAIVTGRIACVAPNLSMDMTPSVSTDGGRVVFESLRGGPFDIWLQEGNAVARRLTRGPTEKGYSLISQYGSRVAYGEIPIRTISDPAMNESVLRVIDLDKPDDPPQIAAQNVGLPCHWYPSSPPRYVLAQRGGQLGLIDVDPGADGTETSAPIVQREGWWIDNGHFSLDGRWIAFSAAPFGDTRRGRIFVAPFALGEAVETRDWLPIFDQADASADGHLPDWSPNGEILYFVSDRDGCRCLWFQRLDPTTKLPLGVPQELYHFGEYRFSPQFQHWDLLRLSVARNRIVLSLANCTGNVFVGRLEAR